MTTTEHDETVWGYKRISAANIKAADVSRLFGGFDEQRWIAAFSEPQLHACVPRPVEAIFEHARRAMIYGWFYYPLLSIGYAECGRTVEAAVRNAGRLLWPDQRLGTFDRLIRQLHEGGWTGA